jgi:hypothetical protein
MLETNEIVFFLYHKVSPMGLNYLGITHKDPFKYRGSGVYWRKHLKSHNFKLDDIETIILFETNDYKELCEKGKYYSKLYDVVNSEDWANLIPETGENSVLGMKHSEETKKKMSESRKGKLVGEKNPMFGKLVSKETRKKISKSNTGQKRSEETKNKLRDSQIGERNSFYGKTHTEDFKLKLSKANSLRKGELANMFGKKHKLETKLKLSQKRKGRNNSNYNPTPILQFDTNNNLIKEWGDLYSLLESGFTKRQKKEISRACRGKIKTYAGFIWKFKE